MAQLDRSRRLCFSGVIALAGALVWVISSALTDRIVNPGDKAPDFSVTTDNGLRISPYRFGGKLLIVNFWATWCEGCLEELESLNAFSRGYLPRGVVVLAVSMDDNQTQYSQFLRRYPVTFENVRDPSWSISHSYGTFQIPETYVIDTRGRVVHKVIGSHNFMNADFLSQIESRL
jgi:cytochrome c biogenesis protein CcmG/thiol:disulfide interchange protein DsbE